MATFNDYANEYKHETALMHLSKMHKAIYKTLYDNEIIDDAISFDSVEKSLENKEYKDWLIKLADYNNDLIVSDRELKAFVISMNLLKGMGAI